jgi:hypothetical protein
MTNENTNDYEGLASKGEPIRFVGDWAKLAEALAKAQGEFTPLSKLSDGRVGNKEFKFSGMDEHISATRPILAKYGITVLQLVHDGEDGQDCITTVVMGHGGRIESRISFNPASDIKAQGGLLTYFARYAFNKLFVLGGGEDADSNLVVPVQARKPSARRATTTSDHHTAATRTNSANKETNDEPSPWPEDEPTEPMITKTQGKIISQLVSAMQIAKGDVDKLLQQHCGTADRKSITEKGAQVLIDSLRQSQATMEEDEATS